MTMTRTSDGRFGGIDPTRLAIYVAFLGVFLVTLSLVTGDDITLYLGLLFLFFAGGFRLAEMVRRMTAE